MRTTVIVLCALVVPVSAQTVPRQFRYERSVVTSGAGHYRLAIDVPLLAGAAPFQTVRRGAAGAPGPLSTEGAAIDTSLFRHLRNVPPGDAGLVVLTLDAAALAGSAGPRGRFADVRIIDAHGRQVPYLVERRNEPHSLDVPLDRMTKPRAAGPQSVYRLTMPFASLPEARLILSTELRVFDRHVTVGVERAADRSHRDVWIEDLASERWVHADRERPAPSLALSIPTTAATSLVVAIDEGDNSALSLGPARLLLPSYRLRFYRGAGEPLQLAYGRDDLAAPRYDLALLTPQVLGVTPTEVTAEGEADRARPGAGALSSPWLFYAVLGIAVLVLLVFVVRLVGNRDGQPRAD